ncbi:MAG: DNA/RNA non-specific endonuclease [Kaiparowitsia implicata GSE-PSE-MK54-09C]|nr:DNA/RNA non-specific endonuclease [Kaiparowitsia implicata GSE-PSE-MK54-09C]
MGNWIRRRLRGVGLAIATCVLVMGCGVFAQLAPPTTSNLHLLLGNPSQATSVRWSANNFLITRPQYALSYNREQGIPNWVSWQLNQDWLGDLPRSQFVADPSLPDDWYAVSPDDYTGSGFDRGHIVPAADRNRTLADSQSVFWMTNIVPQAPDNNQGPWERFERYCRDLVRNEGKELYMISGGAEVGGIGLQGDRSHIGTGRVTVPALLWKIAVVLERPGLGLAGVTADTRVIAVIMPNQQGIRADDWRSYRRSVDLLEQVTGYNFLSELSTSLQALLETQVDQQ